MRQLLFANGMRGDNLCERQRGISPSLDAAAQIHVNSVVLSGHGCNAGTPAMNTTPNISAAAAVLRARQRWRGSSATPQLAGKVEPFTRVRSEEPDKDRARLLLRFWTGVLRAGGPKRKHAAWRRRDLRTRPMRLGSVHHVSV